MLAERLRPLSHSQSARFADSALRTSSCGKRAAGTAGSQLLIASGAVGALDVVSAAVATGSLALVEVEQRKPPDTLLPPDEAVAPTEATVLYDGPARDAVTKYPKTTNISAAIAIAGIGFERTRVRIVADPCVNGNVVEVCGRGTFGSFRFSLTNIPSANPRTSAIVAQSVVARAPPARGAARDTGLTPQGRWFGLVLRACLPRACRPQCPSVPSSGKDSGRFPARGRSNPARRGLGLWSSSASRSDGSFRSPHTASLLNQSEKGLGRCS